MLINRTIIKLGLYCKRGLMPAYSNLLKPICFAFAQKSELERLAKKQGGVQQLIPQINKPHSPDGGIYSVERVIPREQVGSQLKVRLDDLRKRHELLRVSLAQKIDLPYSLCGINRKTYHESFGYLSDRVMSYYRIHHTTITDYLLKIYKASLYSVADRNQTFMNEYWQQAFKSKVLTSLNSPKNKGYSLKVTEEKNFLNEMKESCQIVDSVMVRGLSMNRKENEHPTKYHRYEEDKQFGLVTYTPLYLTQDNQKFNNPETNKDVYKGYEKMVLRVLVLVKTPLRFAVPELPVSQELNTYEHLAVFQNQMVAPPHLQSRYKLQTLVQWLGKYRFGPWRLVDMDNFMRGNSLFRPYQPQEEELEPIFRNSILDKSYYCNIRDI